MVELHGPSGDSGGSDISGEKLATQFEQKVEIDK
jgi:hypothetical protein